MQELEEKKFSWYIIRVASGKEDFYGKQIETAFKDSKLSDCFKAFMVPKKLDFKYVGGEQKQIQKPVFPGYILLNLSMSVLVLNFLKKTLKFTNIIGNRNGEIDSISEEEFAKMMSAIEENNKDIAAVDSNIKAGSSVQITSGSFSSLDGFVERIIDQKKAVVLVKIFGRETKIESDLSDLKLLQR